jgi:hypothetical protein
LQGAVCVQYNCNLLFKIELGCFEVGGCGLGQSLVPVVVELETLVQLQVVVQSGVNGMV